MWRSFRSIVSIIPAAVVPLHESFVRKLISDLPFLLSEMTIILNVAYSRQKRSFLSNSFMIGLCQSQADILFLRCTGFFENLSECLIEF